MHNPDARRTPIPDRSYDVVMVQLSTGKDYQARLELVVEPEHRRCYAT